MVEGICGVRWVVSSAGAVGAVAACLMGVMWLSDALRPQVPALGQVGDDPVATLAAAAALLAATIASVIGSVLAQRPDPRGTATMLLLAGLVPGLIDPRAFVVTWLICLAGMLATSLEPRQVHRRRRPTRVDFSFSHSTETLSVG